MSAALLFVTPLFPLLLAVAGLRWPALSRWNAVGLAPAVAVLVAVEIDSSASYTWWLLGSELGLDRTAFVFLCFTVVLWLTAALLANGEIDAARRSRFSLVFLMTMSGNLGVILAQDAVTFYLFFALMSFASYGLVVQRGDAASRRAGLIYLVGIMIGEVALFVALVMLDSAADGIGFDGLNNIQVPAAVMLLLLLGFGIKSGMLLLHVWMPLAYAAAPSAAAVVLAGAMVKVGLLGWLRFLPLGWDITAVWGQIFLVAGFVAAFYGVVIGLLQRNPKVILAYSSVSQMGLMTALIGVGLLAPQHWPSLLTVTLIYAAHHALVKGALFVGLGTLAANTGLWQRRALLLSFVIVALAMAGAPALSGAVAKLAYKSATKEVLDLGLLLSLSAVATGLLMARLLDCLRYLPRSDRPLSQGPWYLLFALLLLWPALWPTARIYLIDTLTAAHLVAALWPVLAAAAGYGLFMLLRRFVFHGLDIGVPPGDVLMIYAAVVRALGRTTDSVVQYVAQSATAISIAWQQTALQMRQWLRVGEFEALLLRWEVAWSLFLGLMVLLVLAALVV
ncbi:hypothetical protein Tel_08290 [Candidatus Tenderia electrophaga]|jgi:formate hydrogenlyase subunit 3/multisubunit Na+/H+ antiporter MnhD subunit|uniref:NADH:quinone oxidoreductase/Mrp antiporter transmembrane domain-containing protein n=1 Tax=Candidatus Tenderia electrophaga TaxID=1748243 RepID=A0A0S2TDG3_9GAMM|nr:hypothetical protein Tel_08290 [Candidatus Tenderia electrophaga]